jgi:sugar O-acyltransferase (sialic acid O-acetyltransferase NeuD family)
MNEKRKLVVVGAGGHGRVLIDAILKAGWIVDGIVDPLLVKKSRFRDIEVLGDDGWFDEASSKDVLLFNGVGANPDVTSRQAVFESLCKRGWDFGTLIHPFTSIGVEVMLGAGSQVMAGVVLQPGTCIAKNVVINSGALVDHDCCIGNHVFVAPGVVICGNVTVGDSTFLGVGCKIIPNIKIGSNVVVAAGSVVTRDIPNQSKVKGIPASKY